MCFVRNDYFIIYILLSKKKTDYLLKENILLYIAYVKKIREEEFLLYLYIKETLGRHCMKKNVYE